MLKYIYHKTQSLISKPHFQLSKILPSDVFLVSYPRSGNTWVRYLLANLLEPERDWDINNLRRVVPDIYESFPANWLQRSPRVLKSHEPFTSRYKNVIYLYRDGRDVAVSYYDYMKKLHKYEDDFPTFLTLFLTDGLPYGSWHRHIGSWLLENPVASLYSLQYEQLFAAPAQELQKLGAFLGQPWDSLAIQTAIEKASLDHYRKDFRTLKHWRKGFQGGVKGGPGRWREVFTPDQNDLFWTIAGSVAQKKGYFREE